MSRATPLVQCLHRAQSRAPVPWIQGPSDWFCVPFPAWVLTPGLGGEGEREQCGRGAQPVAAWWGAKTLAHSARYFVLQNFPDWDRILFSIPLLPCPASSILLPVPPEITSPKEVTCVWTLISRSASGAPDLRLQGTSVEWNKWWYPREKQMKHGRSLKGSCFKKLFWSVNFYFHSILNIIRKLLGEHKMVCVYVKMCVHGNR